MKIIRFKDIAQVPASHEDPKDPGAVKKVLLTVEEGIQGKIQMVNWATLLPGRSFRPHYHESMLEIFVMMAPGAVANVGGREVMLEKGDALVVPSRETHEMKNPTSTPIEYVVVGIA